MVKLLTVGQCAEYLQVCDRTVRSLIAKNKFCEYKRIGGAIRVDADVFEEWVKNREDERTKYTKVKANRMINKIDKLFER